MTHGRFRTRTSARDDYDDFVDGYITAMLWSTNDESDPNTGGDPLDKNYSRSDLAPEALKKIKIDCAKFFKNNRRDLRLYCDNVVRHSDGSCMEYAGHDFWLTRCGHGCGFWDRDGVGASGRGEAPVGLGKRLTDAAHKMGEVWPYVADGKIYVQ